ncbi:MAG: PA14 domain-containing protein [Planctomycetota bacterium]|nr:PA14 domain-containing protein [Planctomycetota bacterium]
MRKTTISLLALTRAFQFLLFVFMATTAFGEEAARPEIEARISFPFDKGMVRANVPVFGVAWARDFESYIVEFGEGTEPEKWFGIVESKQPQANDPYSRRKVVWNPDWGARGNLATWQTGLDEYPYGEKWEHNLYGLYTLRLTVRTREGRTMRHSIETTVGRVLTNWNGGLVKSPDQSVAFRVAPDSLPRSFLLTSLLPTDQATPPGDRPVIGSVYEFRPPNAKFLKPGTLSFKVIPEQMKGKAPDGKDVPGDKLIVGAYDAARRKWRYLPCTFDRENSLVATEIRQTQPYVAYYGLFADLAAPEPPTFHKLPQTTQRSVFTIAGRAETDSMVLLEVNDDSFKIPCDREGRFNWAARLQPGRNVLSATCRDLVGNLSVPVERALKLDKKHPKGDRAELRILGGKRVSQGRKILVKFTAESPSPEVDVTVVRIRSSATDPEGFESDAVETNGSSGIFVALFEVAPKSSATEGEIGANVDGESITVQWTENTDFSASIAYKDATAPSSPRIMAAGVQRLCWNTFERTEVGLGSWSAQGGDFGPTVTLRREGGNSFLRIRGKSRKQGFLGATAWQEEYSVKTHPVIAFDFQALPDTQVDLLVNLSLPNVGWKGIGLTDKKPYYPRLGHIRQVIGDYQWHHAEVNLWTLLKARYPALKDFRVREIAFADWDGGERLFGTKFFGKSSYHGNFYDIYNFMIGSHTSSGNVSFKWASTDASGIEGYSVVLDQKPGTMPPEKITEDVVRRGPNRAEEQKESEDATLLKGMAWAHKAFEELAEGQWWLHVRAKDRSGNWGQPNHYFLAIDTTPPSAQLLTRLDRPISFDQDIRLRLTDAGAGVDPSNVLVRVNRQPFTMASSAISYDFRGATIDLQLRNFRPFPVWFLDGSKVELSLSGLRDLAGNTMAAPLSWTFEAASPVVVEDGRKSHLGWFKTPPKLALKMKDKAGWTLDWMRSLKGDKYAEKGRAIGEIGLFPKGEEKKPRFVVEIKDDRTVPETRVVLDELPPTGGAPARPLITLDHSEVAYRRGGLRGRYYQKPDFKRLISERVDPFVFFVDDREQFTRQVPGAHSAVWEGGFHVAKTKKVELELAIWHRAPASGRLWIDGDQVIELLPHRMGPVGYLRKFVLLTEGMHHLRLEYREPTQRPWKFALFRWAKRKTGEETRQVFRPGELYYLANVGKTYYRWNEDPYQVHREPFPALLGKNTLSFYTRDLAGNTEQVKTRVFSVSEILIPDAEKNEPLLKD